MVVVVAAGVDVGVAAGEAVGVVAAAVAAGVVVAVAVLLLAHGAFGAVKRSSTSSNPCSCPLCRFRRYLQCFLWVTLAKPLRNLGFSRCC